MFSIFSRNIEMTTQQLKRINAYRMTNGDINDAIVFINSAFVQFPAGLKTTSHF